MGKETKKKRYSIAISFFFTPRFFDNRLRFFEKNKKNKGKIKLEKIDSKIKVTSPYNREFVQRARNLKGKWEDGAWWFDDSILDYVREALTDIYGTSGEAPYEKCSLIITNYSEKRFREPVVLFGRTIARAYGRDSGANLGDDIIFISGTYRSGGSVKNWQTVIDNATFEIKDFPLRMCEREEIKEAIQEGWCEIKQREKRNKQEIENEIKELMTRVDALKKELHHYKGI